ncbi:ABC transporter substrate-binding protein [Maridesulfovibrio ferrireducens]|uniref:substrate-binding periplasmic protein n=1 Tax=Maridesulfovibrio ferrireducens TaxID=246191 RepID=UPI0026ED53B3|nr:ABC transporter substrate-binding protein [Maridesulfovibrio ferrireducens]
MMHLQKFNLYLLLSILLCFLILPSTVYAESFPKLTLITEEWEPYNFRKNGTIEGISTDVLMLMLERAGSTQARNDIKLYPWARSYKMLQKNTNTLLFSTTRTEEREHMFKWVGPIFNTKYHFYALKNRHIKINSFKDLKKYRIGTIRKDVIEDLLVKNADMNSKDFDQVSSTLQNIIKLSVGRVDLAAQSKESTLNSCKEAGLNPNNFESVFVLDKNSVYYAFNKETPDSVIAILQTVFDNIRNEGKLAEIFKKYGK